MKEHMKKYSHGLLIIEGSYLSSIVSAHTSNKVSTSASYNFDLCTRFFAEKCNIEKYLDITFCDSLPFDDGSKIASDKIQRVRKFHNYLKRNNVKVKLGSTEKTSDHKFQQVGVNTEIIDTICQYHSEYDIDVPLVLITADKHLFNCVKRIINEGRLIIFIGSDDESKKLYFKSSLKRLATNFVNLSTEDILKFKDKPGFKKE